MKVRLCRVGKRGYRVFKDGEGDGGGGERRSARKRRSAQNGTTTIESSTKKKTKREVKYMGHNSHVSAMSHTLDSRGLPEGWTVNVMKRKSVKKNGAATYNIYVAPDGTRHRSLRSAKQYAKDPLSMCVSPVLARPPKTPSKSKTSLPRKNGRPSPGPPAAGKTKKREEKTKKREEKNKSTHPPVRLNSIFCVGPRDKVYAPKRRSRNGVHSRSPLKSVVPSQIAESNSCDDMKVYKHIRSEGVGNRLFVYFDEDDAWYYGRIERHRVDKKTGRHYHQVVYEIDGETEWMCIARTRCLYSDRVGIAKSGRWPFCAAELFEVAATNDAEDCKRGDKRQILANFWASKKKKGVRSHAWVTKSNVAELSLSKLNKTYRSTFEYATAERELRMRKYLATLRGADLVGFGVSIRFDALFTNRSKKSGQDMLKGTIRAYDRLNGTNYICFDDVDLRPKWVDLRIVTPSRVFEVALKEEEKEEEKDGSASSSSNATASMRVACALCRRSETFYAKSMTSTGRPIYDDDAAACRSCYRCKRSFHDICIVATVRDLKRPKRTPSMLSSSSSSWLCHDCFQCEGCGAFAADLNKRIVLNYPVSRPQSYEDVSEYLPPASKGGITLCETCEASYSHLEYCSSCRKVWTFDEGGGEKEEAGAERLHADKGVEGNENSKEPNTDVQSSPSTTGEGVEVSPPESRKALFLAAAKRLRGALRRCEEFMVQCDKCDLWCHAVCDPTIPDMETYRALVASAESGARYVCPSCRNAHMGRTLRQLEHLDPYDYFRTPVTEDIAPNYFDVVKRPMDLSTMKAKVVNKKYATASEFRSDVALICFNALTFNPYESTMYKTANRFFARGLAVVSEYFPTTGKSDIERETEKLIQSHITKSDEISEMRKKAADRARELHEMHRLRLRTPKKFDRRKYPDPSSRACVHSPSSIFALPRDGAAFLAFVDACDTCGNFGDSKWMLYCVDCGQARHFFCAGMAEFDVHRRRAHWRCGDCAVLCEICGVTSDEDSSRAECGNSVSCVGCFGIFHARCLRPRPPDDVRGRDFFCARCVNCTGCNNSSDASRDLRSWSFNRYCCRNCDKSQELCRLCRADKGSKVPMVECDSCESWIHIACAGLEAEDAIRLQASNASYLCPPCLRVWHDEVLVAVTGVCQLRERARSAWHVRRREWSRSRVRQDENASVLHGSNRARPSFGHSFQELSKQLHHKGFSQSLSLSVQRRNFQMSVAKLLPATSELSSSSSSAAAVASWIHTVEVGNGNGGCDAHGTSSSATNVQDAHVASANVAVRKTALSSTCPYDAIISVDRCATNWPSRVTAIADPRRCAACRTFGDRKVEGRLLNCLFKDEWKWIHANCALWASETHQVEPGVLQNVAKSISRGRLIYCSHCDKGGGAVGCSFRGCRMSYHFKCAIEANCLFVRSSVFCAKHRRTFADGDLLENNIEIDGHRGHLRCFEPSSGAGTVLITSSATRKRKSTSRSGSAKKTRGRKRRGGTTTTTTMAMQKNATSFDMSKYVYRVGTLTVHRLGEISGDPRRGCFHTDDLIFPCGFTTTRLHWHWDGSPRRCLYTCRVLRVHNRPRFVISATGVGGGEHENNDVESWSADDAVDLFYARLFEAQRRYHTERIDRSITTSVSSSSVLRKGSDSDAFWSLAGRIRTKLRVPSSNSRARYGMNGPQFFGYAIERIANAIEFLPGAAQLALPAYHRPGTTALAKRAGILWPEYHFHGHEPSEEAVKRAALVEKALAAEISQLVYSASGCARCEPYRKDTLTVVVASQPRGGRLQQTTGMDTVQVSSSSNARTKSELNVRGGGDGLRVWSEKYLAMKAIPWQRRVQAKKSRIHGWGIFMMRDVKADEMIVEYTGEVIRNAVGDRREETYKREGMGGCYMFRLDGNYIVDSTTKGNVARFTNHSCQPNSYVKIVTIAGDGGRKSPTADSGALATDGGVAAEAASAEATPRSSRRVPNFMNKKIVFVAKKDIPRGSELLYDYHFALEDHKKAVICNCGAPNCRGRMN
eukprot:g1372.t1